MANKISVTDSDEILLLREKLREAISSNSKLNLVKVM